MQVLGDGERQGASGVILVVDDDPEGRACLADLLALAGYAVLTACDGSDALTLLRSDIGVGVQLILLDIDMPIMTGGEFLMERAADEELGIIPVVVTSAIERCLPGANDFLGKPFKPESVLELAREYCGGSAPRSLDAPHRGVTPRRKSSS